MNPAIGSYAVVDSDVLNSFEDECVGSLPPCREGIVVSRIVGEKVYISDWQLQMKFNGDQLLEQFEEAKHNQDFNFTFSSERELQAGENLDGTDPALRAQLFKNLQARGSAGMGISKIRQFMQRSQS